MTALVFGDFSLDPESGDLRRGGAIVDLRPKLYALLRYMVEHPGRLLSKEELMAEVWAGTHVGDGSLNRAIAELRDALGDDGIIETVPRRGYRFASPVTSARDQTRRRSLFLVVHGDRRIPLFVGENIIGRTPDCEVQLAFGSVSRRHARIVVTDRVTIEDLGSTNGIFKSNQRLNGETELQSGDEVRIGNEKIRLISEALLHAPTDRLT